MEAQRLYGQDATHFTLRFVLGPNPTVDGQLVLELADTFLDQLLFRGSPPVSIWTKAPGMGKQISIGEFSERRWETARRKIRANTNAVLRLEAKTADFPDQTIALNVHANPTGGSETIQSGMIDVTCSLPYLRHVSASREMVDALVGFGVQVWKVTKPSYGFGNLAAIPRRAGRPFAEGGLPDLGRVSPHAERVHPIPVAATGNDIDGNLEGLIVKGRGIKGAYWANYLSAIHVVMAGGESVIRKRLEGMRIEPLIGGLLIIATDSPLPSDSEDNRSRFQRLEAALRPAFLSREETPERKRDLLGYFFRENN